MNVVQLKLFDWMNLVRSLWVRDLTFDCRPIRFTGWEFNQSCVSDFFQCQGNTNSLPVGMSGPGPSNGSNNGNALASIRGHSFSLMTISYISSVSHPYLHNKLCKTWRGEIKEKPIPPCVISTPIHTFAISYLSSIFILIIKQEV